jgi:hypothetical protein
MMLPPHPPLHAMMLPPHPFLYALIFLIKTRIPQQPSLHMILYLQHLFLSTLQLRTAEIESPRDMRILTHMERIASAYIILYCISLFSHVIAITALYIYLV